MRKFYIGLCLIIATISAFATSSEKSGLAVKLAENNATIPNGIGVNIHFRDYMPGIVALNSLGAKWLRMDFNWDRVEKQKGKYDFSSYDPLVRDARSKGIKILAILDYSNKLYEKKRNVTTQKSREAFARFALEMVKRYNGKDIVWEIWNEPNNGGFWDGNNPHLYTALVKEVYKEIKKVMPEAVIAGPSTYKLPEKYIKECLKDGLLEYIDWFSFHPYRRKNPEDLIKDMSKLRALLKKYVKSGQSLPPIICSEWGFSAVQHSEQGQALRVPRAMFLAMMEKMGLYIYYDLWNDRYSPTNSEHNYGLLTTKPLLIPKPAGIAFMAALKIMDGYKFKRRIGLTHPDAKNIYVLEFINKAGELRFVHWYADHDSGKKVSWSLPKEMGNVYPITMGGQRTSGVFSNGDKITSSAKVEYLCQAETKKANYKVIGCYSKPGLSGKLPWKTKADSTKIINKPVITTGIRDFGGYIDFWFKPEKSDFGRQLIIGGDLKKPFITLKIGLDKKGNVTANHWTWHRHKWLKPLTTNQPVIPGDWTRVTYQLGGNGRRLFIDGLPVSSSPTETSPEAFSFQIKAERNSVGMLQIIRGSGFSL